MIVFWSYHGPSILKLTENIEKSKQKEKIANSPKIINININELSKNSVLKESQLQIIP